MVDKQDIGQEIGGHQGTDQSQSRAESLGDRAVEPRAPGSELGSTLRNKGSATMTRVRQGAVGTYWSRLTAVDFMNSSMVFAALALLCLFPVFTILAAATGRSVRHTITIRMGLNDRAADDIDNLISSGHNAVTNLTVLTGIFLLFGVIGLAATLQGWYRRVYDQPAQGAMKTILFQALWFISFLFYVLIEVQIGQHVGPMGGHVLVFVLEFVGAVLFWTLSTYILLLGRVGWHAVVPTGIATAICVTGLAVFSFLLFSSSIISGYDNYGPIGVMSTLMSYFIGLGVCVHLGAVFGRMWNERHGSQPHFTSSSSEAASMAAGSGSPSSTRDL